MFTALIMGLCEVLLWGLGIYVVYKLANGILNGRTIKETAEFKLAQETAEKMAIIKILSNSSREIALFLSENVKYLTPETVAKLANRLETVRLLGDDELENKFSNLESRQKVNLNEGINNLNPDVTLKRQRKE